MFRKTLFGKFVSCLCVNPFYFLQILRGFFADFPLTNFFLLFSQQSKIFFKKSIPEISEALFLVLFCWLPVLFLCCCLKMYSCLCIQLTPISFPCWQAGKLFSACCWTLLECLRASLPWCLLPTANFPLFCQCFFFAFSPSMRSLTLKAPVLGSWQDIVTH